MSAWNITASRSERSGGCVPTRRDSRSSAVPCRDGRSRGPRTEHTSSGTRDGSRRSGARTSRRRSSRSRDTRRKRSYRTFAPPTSRISPNERTVFRPSVRVPPTMHYESTIVVKIGRSLNATDDFTIVPRTGFTATSSALRSRADFSLYASSAYSTLDRDFLHDASFRIYHKADTAFRFASSYVRSVTKKCFTLKDRRCFGQRQRGNKSPRKRVQSIGPVGVGSPRVLTVFCGRHPLGRIPYDREKQERSATRRLCFGIKAVECCPRHRNISSRDLTGNQRRLTGFARPDPPDLLLVGE